LDLLDTTTTRQLISLQQIGFIPIKPGDGAVYKERRLDLVKRFGEFYISDISGTIYQRQIRLLPIALKEFQNLEKQAALFG
jgi:hypothetical protein